MDKTLIFSISLLSLIAVFMLSLDWTTYLRLEKTVAALQTLQKQKEKTLSNPLETLQKQGDPTELKLLNPNNICFTITNLCTQANLLLEKIQFEKPHTKTQDKFEISLALLSNYKNFTALIASLAELPWGLDWKALHISPSKNEDYPLKIKLKLSINAYYSPQTSSKPHALPSGKNNETAPYSPFTSSRHVGKITTDNQTIELIIFGQKQNILRLRKPVLN
jgi:Tfp pilus assembly protein PilO